MKKLIALTIILTILLCSCSTSKPVQYTIYTSSFDDASSGGASMFNGKMPENITIGNLNEKDFSYVSRTETENSKAPLKKEFNIDGKTFELNFELSYTTAIANSELGKKHSVGKYDSYIANLTDGSLDIKFAQSTETIVFFSLHGNARYIEEGDFNKELSKNKADTLISSLYGTDALSKYTFAETTDIVSQTFNGFAVYYRRYIYGYPTSESIMIKFNRNGELISINAEKFGLFDSAKNDITETEIESAEKALRDSVNEDWTLSGTPELVIDSTGGYFLNVIGVYTSPDGAESREPCSFYININ